MERLRRVSPLPFFFTSFFLLSFTALELVIGRDIIAAISTQALFLLLFLPSFFLFPFPVLESIIRGEIALLPKIDVYEFFLFCSLFC